MGLPFDLELAKLGCPVITRGGHPARIVCFNAKNHDNRPLVVMVTLKNEEQCHYHSEDGSYRPNDSSYDLFMVDNKEGILASKDVSNEELYQQELDKLTLTYINAEIALARKRILDIASEITSLVVRQSLPKQTLIQELNRRVSRIADLQRKLSEIGS